MSLLRFTSLGLCLSLAALTGCQHYQWGTAAAGQRQEISHVYIEPVVNQSGLPLASPTLTLRLEERLINRPGHKLSGDLDVADYVLEVTLIQAVPTPRASLPEDTGRDLTFELAVQADIVWRDAVSEEVLHEARVDASSLLVSRQNLPDAIYQLSPDALDELARKILDTEPLGWGE
ncbi:MAG: LPS assembly lipoprotein LptE [Verrucomicrobiota bacterium JB022]|nr:LPS assembly lipoprotein LptE [Verrucomicrobiota bacterium JB022]